MEESLKEQIKLLEEIVALQKKLLDAKPVSYPVYIDRWYPPYYTPYIQPYNPSCTVWTGDSTSDNVSWTPSDGANSSVTYSVM